MFWINRVNGWIWLLLLGHVSCYVEKEATIGGDVKLPCTVDFSGSPQVMWLSPQGEGLTRNSEVLTEDDRISIDHPYQSEWNLEVEGVKASDEGNYTCMIRTSPVQKKMAYLRIVSAPSMIQSSDDVVSETGGDAMLHCEASGTPAPVISWYKYTYIGDREDLGVEGDYLLMYNVTRHMAATYECQADNGVPPAAKAMMRLDVTFAPIVTLPHQYISQEEDRDTFLQCSVISNPYETLHWERDGAIIRNSDKHDVIVQETGHYNRSLLLTIRDLSDTDFGEYTCVAVNQWGSDKAHMELREWQSGHVRLVAPPQDTISSEGLDVVINCTVEQMNPADSITWWRYDRFLGYVRIYESHPAVSIKSRGGNVVYLNADKYTIIGQYNLLIRNVSLMDGGEYMCELSGRKNHSAFVTVVDQLVCEKDSNTTVLQEGSVASLACGMHFSGPIRLWHSIWHRDNVTLSSIDMDEGMYVRRTVSFPVYSGDSGVYLCVISNQKPPYYGQCETVIDIISQDPTPASVCNSGGAWTMSNSDMILMTVASIGGVIIIFTLVLIGVCCHFKKQLKAIRSPESSRHKRNGEVYLETSRLTATEASEHEV